MFDHRVKNRQQFAHAGDQCNFWRFTCRTQASVKFSDLGIAPTGHQRRHVERRTHRSPAAAKARRLEPRYIKVMKF